jgi:WD40 repeat protein
MDISKQSTWKTIRVFISSTFRDMQAERDWLVRFVFPRLREELLKYRIHFVDVDLRWGVTSDQNALGVCREVIDECHPRFLCMLGGRYGWVPDGQDKSITADEIHYGVLGREAEKRGHAFFYFRDDNATARMVEETPGDFREPDGSTNATKLANLKKAITDTGLNPRIYGEDAKWDATQKRFTGIEAFGNKVRTDLFESLKNDSELAARFATESTAPLDEFAEETEQMEAFIEERVERYVVGSRQPLLDALRAFAAAEGTPNIFFLTGDPGSGKSALLAKFARDLTRQPSDIPQSVFVIAHFIGASTGSTDLRRTLRRLCHELARAVGNTEFLPLDIKDLITHFQKLLTEAASKQRVILVFDALNQFDATDGAHWLNWLPRELPPGVRIVASVIAPADGQPEHQTLAILRNRPGTRMEKLEPLTEADTLAVIEGSLRRYAKRLSPEQLAALLAKPAGRLPLYVLTALEELRTLGTYEEITDRIRTLPGDARALFGWILTEHLARDPGFCDREGRSCGAALVEKFAACLGVSRHGLSPAELAALLDPGDPLGNVAALLRLLRPYLMRRGELLDFYHGQFREAATETWLSSDAQRQGSHAHLSDYFRNQADPEKNFSWKGKFQRPLMELPFHLSRSNPEALKEILFDFRFLTEKSRQLSIFSVVADFDLAIPILSTNAAGPDLAELLRCLRVNSSILERFPSLLFQQVYNTLIWRSKNWGRLDEALRLPAATRIHPWLRLLNPPAAENVGTWRVLDAGTASPVLKMACLKTEHPTAHCLVAAAHEDGTLRGWDLEIGKRISNMATGGRRILAIRIAPKGSDLFAYTSDGHLFVFDIAHGQTVRLQQLWNEETECASFASDPDAKERPILCAWAKSRRIYLAYSDGRVQTITHSDAKYVSAITFLGDQPRIVLGGISNDAVDNGVTKSRPASHVEIVGWEDELETPLSVGEGTFGTRLTGWINSIATNDDGDAFVTASEMAETDEHSEFEAMFLGQVVLWRKAADRWQPIFCQGDGSGSFAAAYNAINRQIVAAMWDKGLVLWGDDGREIGRVKLASLSCGALCWADRVVPTILASEGPQIKCFESTAFQSHASDSVSRRHSAMVHTGDISPDLRLVVTGSADERVMVSELVEGQPAAFKWRRDQAYRVNTVAFGKSGEVFSGGYDWTIRSRRSSDGTILAESHNDMGRVGTICVSHSGRILAVANTDGSGFSIWSNKLERLGEPFHFRLPGIKTPMAFSAGDRLLALPEDRGGVVIAKLTDLAEIRDRPSGWGTARKESFQVAHRIPTRGRVSALSFAQCSDTLAIADEQSHVFETTDDQVVRLVRLGSQESLMELACPAVTFLAFSREDLLLAVGASTFVLVFDTRTGREVYRIPVTSPVLCMRFSSDGTRLAYVDDGRSTNYAPQCGVLRLEQTDEADAKVN